MNRPLSLLACLILAAPAPANPRKDRDGDPLPDGSLARFGSVRFRMGPHPFVDAWALSPDGKTLAIANGAELALWGIDSGRAGLRLAPAAGGIQGVCFSPDGKHLVRLDRWHVTLFDVATGRERHSWPLWEEAGAVAFRPGTTEFVVSAWASRRVQGIDAAAPARARVCEAEAPVRVMSPSGRFFLGKSDSALYLVDAATGRVRCQFRESLDPGKDDPLYATFQRTALSPDDRLCAVSLERAILVFDAETGRKLEAVDPPKGGHARLAFSPDGTVLYVGGQGGGVRRRDLRAGRWLDPLPEAPAGTLVPHPDGKRLLVIGSDGVLRRYDLTTLREIPPPGFDGEVSAAASPDGRRVAVSGGRTAARLAVFDRTGRELWSTALPGQPTRPWWAADGRLLACACGAGLTVCDAATGRVLHTLRAPDGTREFNGPIGFDPAANRLIAVLDYGEAVAAYSLGADARVTVAPIPDGRATDISPDGRTVACTNGSPTIALFDVPTERFRIGWTLPPQRPGKAFAVSHPVPNVAWFGPDGTGLFSWADNGMLLLWDPATGEPERAIETGMVDVSAWALSPDGLWLAVAQGGEVSLWEVPTGEYLATRELPHGGGITSLSFVGPGRLLTTSTDHTALLWDLGPKQRPDGPLWDALAGDDARAANQAAWALAADPRGPDILRTRIAPIQPVPAERVSRWIAHLGSDEYRARETAMRELRDLGRLVEPELRAALDKATGEEVRSRLERLLTEMPRLRTEDEVVYARAILALEVAGTEAARKVLTEWAAGAPGARLTIDAKAALVRLAATR